MLSLRGETANKWNDRELDWGGQHLDKEIGQLSVHTERREGYPSSLAVRQGGSRT